MTNNKILVCWSTPLTDQQTQEIIGNNPLVKPKLIMLSDYDPELYQNIIDCPPCDSKSGHLASLLSEVMDKFSSVVLPIGSMSFMWQLCSFAKMLILDDGVYWHDNSYSVYFPDPQNPTSLVLLNQG